jgi:hypothetical protein
MPDSDTDKEKVITEFINKFNYFDKKDKAEALKLTELFSLNLILS